MKKFMKEKCRSPEDSKFVKQALDKVEENSSFIESRRKNVTFKFSDTQAVVSFEPFQSNNL